MAHYFQTMKLGALLVWVVWCQLVHSRAIMLEEEEKPIQLKGGLYPLMENLGIAGLEELDIKLKEPKRQRRAVVSMEVRKWENGTVPYAFDTTYPIKNTTKNLTLEAFAHIEKYTCIRFVERTNEVAYLNITKGSGCWSYIGNTDEMQQFTLGDNCDSLTVLIHESLHALGFLHEHTRPDRNEFITVNYTNVRAGAESQFNVFNASTYLGGITTQNLTYDKQSVMHYSNFLFTIRLNQDGTVTPIKDHMTMYSNADPKETLGNNYGLTWLDKVRINEHYNCNITIPEETTTTTAPTTITAPTTTTESTTTLELSTTKTSIPEQSSTQATSIVTSSSNTDAPTKAAEKESTTAAPETSPKLISTLQATTVSKSPSCNTTNCTLKWGVPDASYTHSISYHMFIATMLITGFFQLTA